VTALKVAYTDAGADVEQRLPIQPLIEKLYASARSIHSLGDAAARGVHRLRYTGLSFEQADRWAVRCRYHPVEVWEGWYDLPLADLPDVPMPTIPPRATGPSLEEALTRALVARFTGH
jgi:hypothetical protein